MWPLVLGVPHLSRQRQVGSFGVLLRIPFPAGMSTRTASVPSRSRDASRIALLIFIRLSFSTGRSTGTKSGLALYFQT